MSTASPYARNSYTGYSMGRNLGPTSSRFGSPGARTTPSAGGSGTLDVVASPGASGLFSPGFGSSPGATPSRFSPASTDFSSPGLSTVVNASHAPRIDSAKLAAAPESMDAMLMFSAYQRSQVSSRVVACVGAQKCADVISAPRMCGIRPRCPI